MEPNQNHPSEREWTPEEKESFFANLPKQPPIEWSTGAWNGPIIELDPEDPFGDMDRIFNRGIHVTSITPPEQGWPVAYHCPLCKTTVFALNTWAIKPSDGDYLLMNDICVDEELNFKHNMEMDIGRTWIDPLQENK